MGHIPNKTYTTPDGSMYRVEPDGSVTRIKSGTPISNESPSKYQITPDGKIYRAEEDGSVTNLGNAEDRTGIVNLTLLNILRIGANKTNVLAAYKARKKCYKICKKLLGRADYKEYVEGLQLDHYPNEFVKAELGKRYIIWSCWFILCWFIFPLMGVLLSPLIIYKCCKLSKKIKSIK